MDHGAAERLHPLEGGREVADLEVGQRERVAGAPSAGVDSDRGTGGAALPALARIRRAGLQGDAQQAGPEPPRALGVVRRELDQREGRFAPYRTPYLAPSYRGIVARRCPPLVGLLVFGALAAVPSAAGAAPGPVWLCKPGLRANPCTPGLSTTRFSPSGRSLGRETVRAVRNPKFDCFYVYPTVSDQKTVQANLHIDPVERSIALYQAARYSQVCRVFAPMYRQATLSAIGSPALRTAAIRAAYTDLLKSWRNYLQRYNKGRGVVLIGHSQGSFVLRQLVTSEIDPKPALRSRLISALLLGGNVTVRRGRDVGGDFKHVPACHSKTQLGCVVAFSTFNAAVPSNSLFGRTTAAGRQVLCTNPAALGGGSGVLDPIFPSEPFAPGSTLSVGIALLGVTLPTAPTTWISAPGSYRARCSSAGGANVLQVSALRGAPTPKASPDPTWGLHLMDANIALGNLVELVRGQGAAYVRAHP